MPLEHYIERPKVLPPDRFAAWVQDVCAVIAALPPDMIRGEFGTGDSVLTDALIAFNGNQHYMVLYADDPVGVYGDPVRLASYHVIGNADDVNTDLNYPLHVAQVFDGSDRSQKRNVFHQHQYARETLRPRNRCRPDSLCRPLRGDRERKHRLPRQRLERWIRFRGSGWIIGSCDVYSTTQPAYGTLIEAALVLLLYRFPQRATITMPAQGESEAATVWIERDMMFWGAGVEAASAVVGKPLRITIHNHDYYVEAE